MIKLDLGGEPAALTNERNFRLPQAITFFNQHGEDHKAFKALLDKGYQVARSTLYERQYEKCAFCESNEDAEFRPVEHFRPKKGAQDKINGVWITVSSHYWWLTWTWENLYFSCQRCNMAGKKGSKFPIETGTVRMISPGRPIIGLVGPVHYDSTAERRLLIDPRVDAPLDHLQWTPVDRRKNKSLWKWTLEGRDSRGDMTIEVLHLADRIDVVNRHLNALRDLWTEVDRHISAGRLHDATRCWDNLLANFIEDPFQQFRNAAWWAADSLCPRADRILYGLRHPQVPEV
jgi:hypothetical protein